MAFSTVFTNELAQTVRLPDDIRFPATVKRVLVRACGRDRIITPANAIWYGIFS